MFSRLARCDLGGLALGLRRAINSVSKLTDIRRTRDRAAPSFTVDVNVNSDSLQDLINRINTADIGATVMLDGGNRRLAARADARGAALSLTDGSNDLFSALGLSTGELIGQQSSTRRSRFKEADQLRKELEDFGDTLSDFFTESVRPGATVELASIRSSVKSALRRAFEDADLNTSQLENLGLEFDLGAGDDDVFEIRSSKLRNAFRQDADTLAKPLSRTSDGGGIVNRFEDAFDEIAATLGKGLGRQGRGLIVDLRA